MWINVTIVSLETEYSFVTANLTKPLESVSQMKNVSLQSVIDTVRSFR